MEPMRLSEIAALFSADVYKRQENNRARSAKLRVLEKI